MKSKLIDILVSGSNKEREKAAREICQRRMIEITGDLEDLLNHHDEAVREIAVIVLGVLGQKQSNNKLNALSKTDKSTNVRIAAIISREFFGKLTYELLKAEIKRFHSVKKADHGDERHKEPGHIEHRLDDISRTAPPHRRPILRHISKHDRDPDKEKHVFYSINHIRNFFVNNKIISGAAGLLLIIVAGVYISRIEDIPEDRNEPLQGMTIVAQIIKERIAAIDKFKKTWLNPENPESRNPMTLELRSMVGDTYGSLFEKVYLNAFHIEIGKNTLGAFWRHINFGSSTKQNDRTLMQKETSGEILLFPNLAAINLLLKIGEETLTYQKLINPDPDLDIRIQVENITVR